MSDKNYSTFAANMQLLFKALTSSGSKIKIDDFDADDAETEGDVCFCLVNADGAYYWIREDESGSYELIKDADMKHVDACNPDVNSVVRMLEVEAGLR